MEIEDRPWISTNASSAPSNPRKSEFNARSGLDEEHSAEGAAGCLNEADKASPESAASGGMR